MEIDRRWPLFDDFIIELGEGRARSTQNALLRIHHQILQTLGENPNAARFSQLWPDLLDPDNLPPSHALATRYLATLRRFATRLDNHPGEAELAQAERALADRHAATPPDEWATSAHPRFGWVQPN